MGVLTMLMNVFGLVFLALPVTGIKLGAWLTWLLVGACAYGWLAVSLFREDYHRSDIDAGRASSLAPGKLN
jgi:hypothetical protein